MYTQQEIELLAAFKVMSAIDKGMLLKGAKSLALKQQKIRPNLQLISSGRVAEPSNDLFGVGRHLKNK